MRQFTIAALTFLAIATSLRGEERYELRGRFVFDGDVPERKALKVDRDEKVCGPLFDESLLVNAKDLGIANVVVKLYLAADKKPPDHPRLEELRKATATVEAHRCIFQPHVRIVLTEQPFVLNSKDSIGHNPKIDVIRNNANGLLIPARGELRRTFDYRESLPVQVGCNIHPWMRSYLVVTDHPYVAVTDASGNFSIGDLPPGEWKFQVWHERVGFVTKVERDGEREYWGNGRCKVTLEETDIDLGEIHVAAKVFADR